MTTVANPLKWLGGRLDVRVQAAVAIEADGARWDQGEWDNNAWASTDGLFEDITDRALRVEIATGRQRWDSRFQAGRILIELDNDDGALTPDAGVNPYDYQFRPGRLVRVVVSPDTDSGETITLATGRIESAVDTATDGGGRIVATVTAVDALGDIAQIDPPATDATGVQRSDQRVTAALDYAGWPAADRLLQVGLADVQSSDLAQPTLEECQRAADAEGGALFANPDNLIVFKRRDWLTSEQSDSSDAYAAAVEAADPVAYWRMSGDATADETGDHALTWNGGPSTGEPGAALDDEAVGLDGTNDYATVADEAALALEQDMTIEFWVRPHDTAGEVQAIISCRAVGDPLFEIFWVPPSGTFYFYPTDSAGAGASIGVGFTAGEWIHVAISIRWTLTQRVILGYLNGVLQGGGTHSYQPSPSSPALNIGRRAVTGDLHFDGEISELAIYDRVLSDAELVARYGLMGPGNIRSTNIQGYIGYDTIQDVDRPHSPAVDVVWSNELARVENDIQLARVGGTAQQATDATSQARFGRRTYRRFDLINNTDGDVAVLAARRLTANKDLRRRIEQVTIAAVEDPDGDGLNRLLYETRFGDLLSVRVATLHDWSFEGLGHVIGIRHVITGDDWIATFTIDDSQIGA